MVFYNILRRFGGAYILPTIRKAPTARLKKSRCCPRVNLHGHNSASFKHLSWGIVQICQLGGQFSRTNKESISIGIVSRCLKTDGEYIRKGFRQSIQHKYSVVVRSSGFENVNLSACLVGSNICAGSIPPLNLLWSNVPALVDGFLHKLLRGWMIWFCRCVFLGVVFRQNQSIVGILGFHQSI